MNKHYYFLPLFVLGLVSFSADNSTEQYAPVLMTRSVLENSIRYESPRNLENLGKIYTKDNYIFISNHYKGIHVIDNRNPAAPVNMGFINVPGCMDIAIKGTSMYVDNAVDLVTIDISDPANLNVTGRVEYVFPELLPPDKTYIPSIFDKKHRPANTVIVEWRKTDVPITYISN
jgi:hypothetical protein